MIHGCGAGRDWTLGCLAMEDDDIRELYPAIPLGTPVTIRP
jgi:lipoprotein-anchoring transpeptidase ErfK/SrfK